MDQVVESNTTDSLAMLYLYTDSLQLLCTTWVTVRRALETGASKMALSATRRSLVSTESTALENYWSFTLTAATQGTG